MVSAMERPPPTRKFPEGTTRVCLSLYLTVRSGFGRRAENRKSCEDWDTMKRILKIMLLATCLPSLTTLLRAQLEDDAGTVTTDTGLAGGVTRLGKDEVKEPAGEPKGTNVTGAETTTEATVEPSDAKKQESQSSAAEEKSSGSAAEK